MLVRAVEGFDVVETLDAVDRLCEVRVDVEAASFELAAHFADLHAGESLRRGGDGSRVLAGMERGVRLGGVGTPVVAEFACAELGARMRMGTWAARRYLADALDVRHRLPLVWARVVAREARIANVRLVAARTRHLSMEAAAAVDAAMVGFVDGSLPWGRFEARLEGQVVAADPEVAAVREEERARVQFAKRTRSCEDGTAGFYLRSTVGVIARVEATVAYVAQALKAFGDDEDLDRRRVKALVVLCNPARAVELLAAFTALRARSVDVELPLAAPGDDHGEARDPAPEDALARMDAFARRVGFTPTRLPAWLTWRDHGDGSVGSAPRPVFSFDWSQLLPPVTLNLHLAAETLAAGGSGVARWEGEGPVTHRFVHEHLRPLHDYVITPVIDLAHLAPVDAYEIPDRHRRAVHLRTPADCFPYSSNLSPPTSDGGVDIDHTLEYQPAPADTRPGAGADAGGKQPASRLGNYGPLGRFHHRIKTHGHWTVRQPFDGIYLWRDRHGQIYLVDHTGTHKITNPGTTAGPARRYDPDLELVHTDTLIETDFDHTA